jgi:hypothetical protein
MILLHPIPETHHVCPYCGSELDAQGWYIPGMRNVVDLLCPQCKRRYYGDLPVGHGLYYPMLLEQNTGNVHDPNGVPWFADILRKSYAQRVSSVVDIKYEQLRELRRPLLLNCLDKYYGHCLLKLLNSQFYIDHCTDFDLIVMIPSFLRWMVPDGVAAVWTVELPLKRGDEWNDWLAREIQQQLAGFDVCWISLAFSHPHPQDFEITRFTRVEPFPIEAWDIRLQKPTVTFVWREERLWSRTRSLPKFQRLLKRDRWLRRLSSLDEQYNRVLALFKLLRQAFPSIDIAVVGLGTQLSFPNWINDMRSDKIDDAIEKLWCERYANSHLVIGVHGSNMLLPSAHAGAVVDLMPENRLGNQIQDLLPATFDAREALLRYQFLPLESSPAMVARTVISLLQNLGAARLNFARSWTDHATIGKDPSIIQISRRTSKSSVKSASTKL